MTSKKRIRNIGGRPAPKIRVTSIGKPPLSGAAAFARLMAAVLNR